MLRYPHTDRDAALDAITVLQHKARMDGRAQGVELAKSIRALATMRPMNQKQMLQWMDDKIKHFQEDKP